MPVIPATPETEAGESLELWSWKPSWTTQNKETSNLPKIIFYYFSDKTKIKFIATELIFTELKSNQWWSNHICNGTFGGFFSSLGRDLYKLPVMGDV